MRITRTEIDAARERRPLSWLVAKFTVLRRDGRYHRGLCPFHKEKTPSFWVCDETFSWGCFGCSASGDAIDFIMQTEQVSFQEACHRLCDGMPQIVVSHKLVTPQSRKGPLGVDNERRMAHAHAVWLKRMPVEGTLAETYLRETRRIDSPIPSLLGYVHEAYCSPMKCLMPALVAPLQNQAGHVVAIQQIFLERETGDAARDDNGRRVKRTLGVMGDASVRLAVPLTHLGLAGSVEDALAAMKLFSIPVWATCGEHRMASVFVPETVAHLLIFADSDEAGLGAAQQAEWAHRKRIKNVNMVAPSDAKDWAAYLEQRAA